MPGTPSSIADVTTTKIILERSVLPIKHELRDLFPTLLANGAEGMPQLFLKVDNEKGTILKSDTPLKVGLNLALTSLDRLCFIWWTSCRRTQRCNGTFRHDKKTSSRFPTLWISERTTRDLLEQLH